MPEVYSGLYFKTIKEGSAPSGDDIRFAQIMLSNFSFHVTADGVFGPKTTNAVINFQKRSGITADGIIGTNTWSRLAPTLSENYNYWNKTTAIKLIQNKLNLDIKNLIEFEGDTLLKVDGVYGSKTKAQVKKFQRYWQLTQDGIWGKKCWGAYMCDFY